MSRLNETGFCENCGAQVDEDANFCPQCAMPTGAKSEDGLSTGNGEPGPGKLFHVVSAVYNFHYKNTYYDNLRIDWFVVDRETPQLPFEEVILNYSELSPIESVHPENFIKECFTGEEAELLKSHLIFTEKMQAVIRACSLPVNKDASGYRSSPPPAGTDFIVLHKREGYNLPFKVEGIFNTKSAVERVEADESITIVSGISIKDIEKRLRK